MPAGVGEGSSQGTDALQGLFGSCVLPDIVVGRLALQAYLPHRGVGPLAISGAPFDTVSSSMAHRPHLRTPHGMPPWTD